MERLDFGKVVTIVIFLLVVLFFFGDKAMHMYKHQNDLNFELNNIVYTKKFFDAMEADERETLLSDISNLCVRKHYADELSCTDTSYWLANALEGEGVDADLAGEWMPVCMEACLTQQAPPPVVQGQKKKVQPRKRGEYGGATKWFWED
jgi:hypothetical protein